MAKKTTIPSKQRALPAAQALPPKSETKNKVHNLARLDSRRGLPVIMGGHAFYSIEGEAYYPFLRPDDNLFRTLLEIRLQSITQGNCINDKTLYSIGEGLQVTGQKTFPKAFDKKINGKGQTIDDVLKGIFESVYQDGNKFVEIARMKVAGQKYVYCYPHNNLDCRLWYNPDEEEPTHVVRSRAFRRDGIINFPGKMKDKPVPIPIWSDNELTKEDVWLKDSDGVERTMIVIKNEVQSVEPYGLPTNFPGLVAALSEHKAGRFNLDNFDNNMFLAGVLSILGQTSEEEAKSLLKDIRQMYIGEGNNQRIFVVSSENSITDTKFTPFTQPHEGSFVPFDQHNANKIVAANGWSKELLDMNDGGSALGKGGAYLAQLFQRKFRTIISPTQQIVMNSFLFPFMKIIDEYKGTNFYSMKWYIKPVVPVSLEGALDLNSLLTVDEGREEIGKGPSADPAVGKQQIVQISAAAKAKDTGTQTGGGIPGGVPGGGATNAHSNGKAKLEK